MTLKIPFTIRIILILSAFCIVFLSKTEGAGLPGGAECGLCGRIPPHGGMPFLGEDSPVRSAAALTLKRIIGCCSINDDQYHRRPGQQIILTQPERDKRVKKPQQTDTQPAKQPRPEEIQLNRVGAAAVFSTDNILISKFVGIITTGLYSNYVMIRGFLNLGHLLDEKIKKGRKTGSHRQDRHPHNLIDTAVQPDQRFDQLPVSLGRRAVVYRQLKKWKRSGDVDGQN